MNWFRTILDGVAMSAVFNSYVAVFWLLKPHSFITMFPKDLQKGSDLSQRKRDGTRF